MTKSSSTCCPPKEKPALIEQIPQDEFRQENLGTALVQPKTHRTRYQDQSGQPVLDNTV